MDGGAECKSVPQPIRITQMIIKMVHDKKTESLVAVSSFLAAVALAFTSLLISEDHDIAAGVLMMCAQFLMLTATIFGLDYKIGQQIRRMKSEEGGEK